MAVNSRNSNIELLRIFAIMGVVLLHYNNYEMGKALAFTMDYPINHIICTIVEALAICAVDLFILISGYFLIDSDTRNIAKVIELIFQVILFKVILYLIDSIICGEITIKGLVKAAIPNNYFVILYLALYLISPLINIGYKHISDKSKIIMLIICFAVFSVWTFFIDEVQNIFKVTIDGISTVSQSGSLSGYTIVNFALMYLVGAGLKIFKNKIKIKTVYLWMILIGTVVIISLLSYIGSEAWYYNSPFIIIEAIVIFILFSRINIGHKKWINSLAKASFICYLIHMAFIKYLFIEYFVTKSPVVLILHMILSAAIIYLISWVIYKIYDLIFGRLFIKLKSIPKMIIRIEEK